jgi:hypothetical protein
VTNEEIEQRALAPSTAEQAFAWFHRLIAIYCLLFGVLYWVRLIGFYDGELWRFDLMPVHWQVAAVALAALFPFAAIGLWMLASWGPVIWFICAATETVMYLGFPELFGERSVIVASHASVIALYLIFRLVIYFQSRGER